MKTITYQVINTIYQTISMKYDRHGILRNMTPRQIMILKS